MAVLSSDLAPDSPQAIEFLAIFRFLSDTGSLISPTVIGILSEYFSIGVASLFCGVCEYIILLLYAETGYARHILTTDSIASCASGCTECRFSRGIMDGTGLERDSQECNTNQR